MALAADERLTINGCGHELRRPLYIATSFSMFPWSFNDEEPFSRSTGVRLE
jgi:hypothetical protein